MKVIKSSRFVALRSPKFGCDKFRALVTRLEREVTNCRELRRLGSLSFDFWPYSAIPGLSGTRIRRVSPLPKPPCAVLSVAPIAAQASKGAASSGSDRYPTSLADLSTLLSLALTRSRSESHATVASRSVSKTPCSRGYFCRRENPLK